jgi:serine/threonine-protein kinase
MSQAGAYTVLKTLSTGGMGRVDLAVRREGDFVRFYAIKRLLPHLREDDTSRAMFADEARIAGLVHHPNVVGVLDVGEDDEGPFLAMEYVEGLPLSDIVDHTHTSGELLPVQLCLQIAIQIAEGLHATHELTGPDGAALTVVHRDISPQNVLVGYDGVVRITDFGIAKASRRTTSHTTTGVLKGKVGYMAPEQLRFEDPDRRSDLYALGVILFELLSGERLYEGNEQRVAHQILTAPPPDIEDARDDVPPGLVELLFELLAKKPNHRPATAEVVARRLQALRIAEEQQEGLLHLVDFMHDEFADRHADERRQLREAMERVPRRAWPLRAAAGVRGWKVAAGGIAMMLAAGALWMTTRPWTARQPAHPNQAAPGTTHEASRQPTASKANDPPPDGSGPGSASPASPDPAAAPEARGGLRTRRDAAAADGTARAGRNSPDAAHRSNADRSTDARAKGDSPDKGSPEPKPVHDGPRDAVSSPPEHSRERRRRSDRSGQRGDTPRVKAPLWDWP